jgi:hypothetical protein
MGDRGDQHAAGFDELALAQVLFDRLELEVDLAPTKLSVGTVAVDVASLDEHFTLTDDIEDFDHDSRAVESIDSTVQLSHPLGAVGAVGQVDVILHLRSPVRVASAMYQSTMPTVTMYGNASTALAQ